MKKIIIAMSLMVIGSFGASITFPGISFADDACSNKGKILTLKPWYSGLTNSDCSLKNPDTDTNSQANYIWKSRLISLMICCSLSVTRLLDILCTVDS